MPWYLYLALKQLFPSGKRFPFFTAISILGVALGVALLVISTSVMGGFGREIRRMVVDTQGDVQVRANGYISAVVDDDGNSDNGARLEPFLAKGMGLYLQFGVEGNFDLNTCAGTGDQSIADLTQCQRGKCTMQSSSRCVDNIE